MTAVKLMKLPAVLTRVAISRSKLYANVKAGTFPPPISLGARAVAWLEHEVEDWIVGRVEVARKIVPTNQPKAEA